MIRPAGDERLVGLLMATVTAISWAVLAIALKYSVQFLSSGTVVWIRMVVAFALLFSVYAWRRPRALRILLRPPTLAVVAALAIACNYFGFMKGVELTTASNAQIMIQFAPLGFAISSLLIFKEKLRRIQKLGLLMAVLGFAFFFWDQILMSLDHLERFRDGNLWLGLAAVTWIAFAIIQKKMLAIIRPQEFNLLIYAVSALALWPMAHPDELVQLTPSLYALVFFLALNTVIAYGALSEALTRAPASQVSVIIAVNPLLTLAIMAYLAQIKVEWLRTEPIAWRGALGAVLVVAGVILTVSRPARLSPVEA